MRWWDRITNSMDINLSKFWEMVEDRGDWRAAVHRVTKSPAWLSDWTKRGRIFHAQLDMLWALFLSMIRFRRQLCGKHEGGWLTLKVPSSQDHLPLVGFWLAYLTSLSLSSMCTSGVLIPPYQWAGRTKRDKLHNTLGTESRSNNMSSLPLPLMPAGWQATLNKKGSCVLLFPDSW